jgi:hypothetical protein
VPLISALVGAVVSLIWLDDTIWYLQVAMVSLVTYLIHFYLSSTFLKIGARFVEMTLFAFTVLRLFLFFNEGLTSIQNLLSQGLFILYVVASIVSIVIFIRLFNQKEQAI